MPAAPVPSWDLTTVYGTFVNADGTRRRGRYEVSIPVRLTSIVDDTVIAPGLFASGALDTTGGDTPSVSVACPATDDPHIVQDGWAVGFTVFFNDGAVDSYQLAVPVDADSLPLSSVVLPGAGPTAPPLLALGRPGGAALLDSAGHVIDAAGTRVLPAVIVDAGQAAPEGLPDHTLVVELTA